MPDLTTHAGRSLVRTHPDHEPEEGSSWEVGDILVNAFYELTPFGRRLRLFVGSPVREPVTGDLVRALAAFGLFDRMVVCRRHKELPGSWVLTEQTNPVPSRARA